MHNLSLLSQLERDHIELDKQAAYTVWKVKNGKAGFELFFEKTNEIREVKQKDIFTQAIEKYKQKMGL